MNVGAEMTEASGEILVAAIDWINISKDGSAGSGKHGDQDNYGRTERRRSDELGGAPIGRTLDINPVGIKKLDFSI